MTFSQYWQADSRPTHHEYRRDLRSTGYRPRASTQSVPAQRFALAFDCEGHPADSVSSVDGERAHMTARKDGQGGEFLTENHRFKI